MDKNKNNSDRDKILDDILSMVENGSSSSRVSRAERAAASQANRAASQRKTLSEDKQTRNENSYERTGSLGKTSGMRKVEDSGRLSRTDRVSQAEKSKSTVSGKSDSSEYRHHSRPDNRESAKNSSQRSYNRENTSSIRTVKTLEPDRRARSKKSRKTKKRSGRVPVVLIVTTLIFTVAISLSVLIISVGRDMLAIGKSDEVKIVTIPEGSTTDDVAQILYDEGIIKMPEAFKFISKLGGSDTKYIAGDHELSPSYAYETIINELTTDKSLEQETVDVTFIEGCDLISAGKQLEEAGVCDAERFVYYFNAGDYGFEFEQYLPTSSALKFNRMEGYLFPDTYTFYVNTDPEVVCQKIYRNFNDKFRPEFYTRMSSMNMTLDEVVTLASIVQAESADVETMKKVASVFENRLANPEEYPKLQSDPTTYYVEEVIKPNIEIDNDAMCEAYDTYTSNGLPPGAIGNPGLDAIEAVLYPEDTDYYYFYANIDTKETFFAKTDEEHEQNKEMVRQQQEEAEGNEE